MFVKCSRTCSRTYSLIVREHIRLLFTNKLVKINRADLKPISNIIIFKRAELEHSLKNLNEHESISNNLKNKRTIREQSQTRLGSDRLQPYSSSTQSYRICIIVIIYLFIVIFHVSSLSLDVLTRFL